MSNPNSYSDDQTEPVRRSTKWYVPTNQKFLFGALILFFASIIIFISLMHFGVIQLNQDRINLIAITMLLTWSGILVGYYVWAIYHYNINLGYPQRYWDILWQKIREARIRKQTGQELIEPEPEVPNENPYRFETLGLPHGTVRGTIALTLLVGALAMLILAIGAVQTDPTDMVSSKLTEGQSILFNRLFDFFVVAFQMMIAFYFGANSLRYLKGYKGSDSQSAPDPDSPPPAGEDPPLVEGPPATDPTEDTPPVSGEDPVDGSPVGPMGKQEFQQKATALGLEPAFLRAITELASNGKGFLPPESDGTADGRLSLRFDGKAFYDALKTAGKDADAIAAQHPKVCWTACESLPAQTGKEAYDLLEAAVEVARTQGLLEDFALLSGRWGLFGIPGKDYKAAGFTGIINFQSKQEISESNQFEAFITLCKQKGWMELLKGEAAKKFVAAWWGNCGTTLSMEEELKDLYNQYVQEGWNS